MYTLTRGDSPVLVSVPHAGTVVPAALQSRFRGAAASLSDTDWFVDQLYSWAPQLGCSMIVAHESRFVIDVNRPPNDQPLYQTATTGLVPRVLFDGTPIYADGDTVGDAEIAERRMRFYEPYHDELADQLRRIKAQHGYAILFDAHSIRSCVPRLFEGRLPDLNLGTNGGQSSCLPLIKVATHQLQAARDYSHVVDGRFRGGYITRHYGQPNQGMHALQLELSQLTYMDEERATYSESKANALQKTVLRPLIQSLIDWTA